MRTSAAVVLGACLLVAAAFPREASAFSCSATTAITQATQSFDDCAGLAVTVESFTDGELVLSASHVWGQDAFTDLHVTILQGISSLPQLDDSHFLNDDGDAWHEEGVANSPGSIDFIANDFSERVSAGDEYTWLATFLWESCCATTTQLSIAYTMDVPEPALGVVLLSGLAALVVGRRRPGRSC